MILSSDRKHIEEIRRTKVPYKQDLIDTINAKLVYPNQTDGTVSVRLMNLEDLKYNDIILLAYMLRVHYEEHGWKVLLCDVKQDETSKLYIEMELK